LPDPATPSLIEEERRQVEMAPLAGLAVQLDQRHLDLRMAVRRGAPVWPEHGVDAVDEPPGDGQQLVVADSAPVGDRRLDQMAGAVELVAVGEVGPAASRLGDRVVGVDVAIVALAAATSSINVSLLARSRSLGARAISNAAASSHL
jgi:hypothetical protein